jgi:hypothetical protein
MGIHRRNVNPGPYQRPKEPKVLQSMKRCWADSTPPQSDTQEWAAKSMISRVTKFAYVGNRSHKSLQANTDLLRVSVCANKILDNRYRDMLLWSQKLLGAVNWVPSIRIWLPPPRQFIKISYMNKFVSCIHKLTFQFNNSTIYKTFLPPPPLI